MLPPHKDDPEAGGEAGDREAQVAALAKQAQVLSEGVAALASDQGTAIVGLAERGRSTRRWVTLIGASLALDVLLTVGLGFAFDRGIANTARVDELSSNTRNQLCGMLQIFVNSDTAQSAAIAKARGDDMAARARSFTLIRHSYGALDCARLVK